MRRPRVLLADDHTIVVEAFKKLLEPDCEIVGMVADGRALLLAAPRLNPDVIVLDISMPLLNGLDAGRQLKKLMPSVKLIFLTMNEDYEIAAEALRCGASGYLLKSSAASELLKAIQEALKGRSYLTPQITRGVVDALAQDAGGEQGAAKLTARQREVLQLLAEGKSMKEVAAVLGLTPRTVAFHKYQLMEKLHIKSNAELVQFAIKHRMVAC